MRITKFKRHYDCAHERAQATAMKKINFLLDKKEELDTLEKSLVQELEATKLTIETLLQRKKEEVASELWDEKRKFIHINRTLWYLANNDPNNNGLKEYLNVIDNLQIWGEGIEFNIEKTRK